LFQSDYETFKLNVITKLPHIDLNDFVANTMTKTDYYIVNTLLFEYFINKLMHTYTLSPQQETFL